VEPPRDEHDCRGGMPASGSPTRTMFRLIDSVSLADGVVLFLQSFRYRVQQSKKNLSENAGSDLSTVTSTANRPAASLTLHWHEHSVARDSQTVPFGGSPLHGLCYYSPRCRLPSLKVGRASRAFTPLPHIERESEVGLYQPPCRAPNLLAAHPLSPGDPCAQSQASANRRVAIRRKFSYQYEKRGLVEVAVGCMGRLGREGAPPTNLGRDMVVGTGRLHSLARWCGRGVNARLALPTLSRGEPTPW